MLASISMRQRRFLSRAVLAILLSVVGGVPAVEATTKPKAPIASGRKAGAKRATTAGSARKVTRRPSARKTARPAAAAAPRPKKPAAPVRSRTPQAPVPLTVASPVVQTGCLSRAELDPLAVSFGLSQADMDELLASGQATRTEAAAVAPPCVSVATSSSPTGTVETVAFVTAKPQVPVAPALLHRDMPLVTVQSAALTCELASPASVTLPADALGGELAEVLADLPESLRWEVGIVARRMAADRDLAGDETIRVLYTAATADAPARLLGVERLDAATGQGRAGVWWLPRSDRPGALVGAGDVDYERLLWQSAIDYRQISRGVGNATRTVRRRVTVKNAKGERTTRVRLVRIPVAHIGVDMSAQKGTPIHAVADATVAFAGRRGAFGNLVILDHGQGYQTYYAHLSAFAEDTTPGRVVRRGQVLGLVGATGRATGPHLHFEVRQDGRYVDPFDETHQIPVWGLQPDEASTVLLRALALRAARHGTTLPSAGCSGSDTVTLD